MKTNSLNLIRILAALQVFLGHTAVHLNFEPLQLLTKPLAIIQGVPVFFLISGFLIWNSLNRDNSLKSFAQKRILRLYPELWGGVLLSVITILFLYGESLNWPQFIAWILTQSTVLQFWTPDCLRGYGCGTPNGSLWTIGVMVQAYVVIWFFHKVLHKKSIARWIVVLVIAIALNISTPYIGNYVPEIIVKLFGQTFLPYIWIFVFGAMICEYFNQWKDGLMRYWWIFLIISAVITFTGFDLGTYGTLKVLSLVPAVIGFAYKFPKLNIKKDISYGLYIYHMVVVNVLIEFDLTGSVLYVILALIVSVMMAFISYHTTGTLYRKQKEKAAV